MTPDFGEKTKKLEKHIGQQLRSIRVDKHLTQTQLGTMVGVSSHQIHKYEHGHNRISAGQLFMLANAMGVSVTRFYHGLRPLPDTALASSAASMSQSLRPHTRIEEAVVDLLDAIENAQHRKK
ncbi:hypothetical protein GCM10017044_15080 [Kordiimonas sediminis]|uniref:HTH cro/C1-type domain-containing protein n=1 Tax=Kordiimonas sediminis TaxID=1735581 RepID=A0A919ARU9_9PROT|nr:helix-turn-helix transcriptional regulator [Kordiimonas sediminis]GHF21131.1 hypothetical protein GCM10017044_15080 [Kordiimonas sediminis]